MPLDQLGFTPAALLQPYAPPSPEVFWAASPAERRIYLAELLEHEEKLPLRWDFTQVETHCGTEGCAIGSARTLWSVDGHARILLVQFPLSDRSRSAAEVFGMSYADARYIFSSGYAVVDLSYVTPAMVAAKLRAYVDPVQP